MNFDDRDEAFSRRPGRNPFGKLDADLGHLRTTSINKEILQERSASLGMDMTELLQRIIDLYCHGFEEVSRLEQERLRRIAGIGSESGEART